MGSPLGNFPSHPLFGCEHRYRSSDTGTQRSGVSRRYSHARLRCNHRFGRSTRTREALYGEIRNAIRSAPTRSQLAPWLAALTISHQGVDPSSHVLPIRPIGQKCLTRGEKCTRARAPSKASKRTASAPFFAPRARGRIPSRIHAYLREERQSPIRWARNLLIGGSARRGSMRMCRPAPPGSPAPWLSWLSWLPGALGALEGRPAAGCPARRRAGHLHPYISRPRRQSRRTTHGAAPPTSP